MGNIVVNLPDGSGKDLPKDSNGNDLAALIGPGLAKDAVAMSVNGEQRDLSDTLAAVSYTHLTLPTTLSV